MPTDTIYGIACCIDSDDGIKKLYDIKKRRADNPISICVAEVQDMQKYVLILEGYFSYNYLDFYDA